MNLDLTKTVVEWRGLAIAGSRFHGSPFRLVSLDGWEDLPATRRTGRLRPTSHGEFPGRVLAGGREVILTGRCRTPEQRDELLLELQDAMGLPASGLGTEDLVVTKAGRTLRVGAQLTRCKPTLDDWGRGWFGFAVEWFCPDPFRYGTPETVSTGLPQDIGGLRFDLFTDGAGNPVDYLDFGPLGTTGRVTVSNPGSAEARSLFAVTGSMPLGFELIETQSGRRLRYEAPVTTASTVTLDSATGRVRLDSADRGGALTRAEWWGIPKRSSRDVLFQSLSGYVADARLTVTTYPTYW